MIVGPEDLTLIDLPENALFLSDFVLRKPLMLPGLAIPIFVRLQVCCIVRLYSGKVDPWVIFGMTIGVDVVASS